MKFLKNKNRGFTLLFAVLIASVLLSVALAIFSQMYKTLLLSSAGKESLAAFYAADSGIECVLYWDLKHDNFDESIFPNPDNLAGGSGNITCDGQMLGWTITTVGNPVMAVTTDFSLSFVGNSSIDSQFKTGGCTEVKVSKKKEGNGDISTTIESRGNNICDSSPRKVERAIRVTY